MLRRILFSVVAAWAMLTLSTFESWAQSSTPRWLRYASISPDASQVAFTYKGEIFVVPTQGGMATRITSTGAYESHPRWSPDGKQIAFMSNRDGYTNVYITSSQGGMARRVTTVSSALRLLSFTPDGRFLVVVGQLQPTKQSATYPSGRERQLYLVPVEGGTPRLYSTIPQDALTFSHNGKSYVAQDVNGVENIWRKHHVSSTTRNIYRTDLATGKRQPLTLTPGEDLDPVWSADDKEVYFLSQRDGGSLNVYKMSAQYGSGNNETKKISHFKTHPVRFLSSAQDGTLCYAYDGDLYTQRDGQEPKKIEIAMIADFSDQNMQRISSSRGAQDITVSQDGKQIAFVYRGDLFVTSVEYNTTKQITSTPWKESSPSFSPDGKNIVYASYRNGKNDLYMVKVKGGKEGDFVYSSQFEESPLIAGSKREKACPQYSPDGKEVAYLIDRTHLAVYNLESKKSRLLSKEPVMVDRNGNFGFEWSPDSKWIAFSYVARRHAPYSDVGFVSSRGGEIYNVTNSGYFSYSPKWVMGGNALLFATDKYGMRNHASWGSMEDALIVYMNRKTEEKMSLSQEYLDRFMESGADSIPAVARAQKPQAEADTTKTKKKDQPKEIEIEFDGLQDRVHRITPNSSNLSDLYVDKEGKKLYYLTSFEGGYNLWAYDLRKGDVEMIRKLNLSNGWFVKSFKEDKLYICSTSGIKQMNLANNTFKDVNYSVQMEFDSYAERAAMYETVVREEQLRFYREDMHGVDWKMMTDYYRQFLPHISNGYDFSELLSELLGELNVSHTGSGFGGYAQNPSTAELGLFFDYKNLPEEGITVSGIIPRGPFDLFRSKVKEGDRLVAIDGHRIDHKVDFKSWLNGKVGKYVVCTFAPKAGGAEFDEEIRAISAGEQSNLLYQRWIKQRAEEVEHLSGGRLGYVHIPSMGDEAFREVYSDVLGKYNLKEGIVIDIRHNGGGRLHEDIETFFGGKQYLMQEVRGEDYCIMPSRRWTKASIMVVNESDYSNAHGTPWMYQTLKMGKVVGMPVPGTMTSVNWQTLQDPMLYFGIPVVGYRTSEGKYLENLQLEPDIQVPFRYEESENGRDTQLEAAVKALLQEIDNRR